MYIHTWIHVYIQICMMTNLGFQWSCSGLSDNSSEVVKFHMRK